MDQIETSEPKVLGIALVVEELGKGSRLIFRYPSSSPSDTNIFFTLSPRVFAKLFHTKLHGQPVTLLVDGTMICCRSVMLQNTNATTSTMTTSTQSDETSSVPSKSTLPNVTSSPLSQQSSMAESPSFNSLKKTEELYTDGLVMFSIVVALLPVQRQTRSRSYHSVSNIYDAQDAGDKVSVAYPVIRRIHLSLSRVCAVLEREERRCMYISRQVAMLIKMGGLLDIGNDDHGTRETLKGIVEGSPGGQNHLKQVLLDPLKSIENELYERMESMLTAKPPPSIEMDSNIFSESNVNKQILRKLIIPLHGNLASELAQIYHSLARDNSIFCNPMYLLSHREGIVYINNHIAVNIDAAVEDENTPFHDDFRDNIPLLRPYHTILFPRVSAKDLLHNINTSFSLKSIDGGANQMNDSDLSQRRLEKMLSVCDPSKSLHDMASETALPLSVITDVALRLVESGVCIAVPQLQSCVKFACQHDSVQKLSSLRLQFAQEFAQVPIFVVISALTVKPNYVFTFGEILRYCKETAILESRSDESDVDVIKDEEYTMMIPIECKILTRSILNSTEDTSISDDGEVPGLMITQHVESIIRRMTMWLRSRAVIVELKDYLVAPDIDPKVEPAVLHDEETSTIKKSNSAGDIQYLWGDSDAEALFHECKKNDYFSGKISTGALAWRIGKRQMEIVREYGIREQRLQLVTRIPCAGEDDWGAP